MLKFTCKKCNKEFEKKHHLKNHLNKKFPCIQNIILFHDIPENSKKVDKIDENEENIIKNENSNNIFCNYCNKNFSTVFNLNKHIKDRCKVKKLQDEEKENIFKILLLKEEELKLQKEQIDKLTKMNFDLNNKINKLIDKVSIQNINKGVINNINNINNIVINQDKLCKFGTEDIKLIDNKLFNNVTNKMGKEIIIECAKNIYNNLSKNKTMHISDLSRKKCMIWDGNGWNLISMNKAIVTVEEQIRKYFNYNENNYEKLKDPKYKKDFDIRIKKYYKMYYDDYEIDDKDEPSQERIAEFQKIVNDGLIQYFYNITDDVKNNYCNIITKIKDDKLFNNNIEYIPIKKRGRPKKIIEIKN
jgi:hypothetical protein